MRVAIAGAGAVGRWIAQRLVDNGHKVLIVERQRSNYAPKLVPGADWMFADACEVGKLRDAQVELCDVVVATAGDDKVNLVFALLCKTEFCVPRVVARVNNPANQWLFTDSWGVDVAVDTPTRLVAAVEEAVAVGEVVALMRLGREAYEHVVELRLGVDSPLAGRRPAELGLPDGARLVSILRAGTMVAPDGAALEPDDEIVLVVAAGAEDATRAVLTARPVA